MQQQTKMKVKHTVCVVKHQEGWNAAIEQCCTINHQSATNKKGKEKEKSKQKEKQKHVTTNRNKNKNVSFVVVPNIEGLERSSLNGRCSCTLNKQSTTKISKGKKQKRKKIKTKVKNKTASKRKNNSPSSLSLVRALPQCCVWKKIAPWFR